MTRSRLFLAALVGALLYVTVAEAMPDTAGRSPQQSQHLYVVFLAGLCPYPKADPYCQGQISASARARATFRTLISAMSRARITDTPAYYSYSRTRAATYTVQDTHQSVGTSASVLQGRLAGMLSRDPRASFVLVGHSLGGVVAAATVANLGKQRSAASRGLLSRVHSVVTFDSPVRGVRNVGNDVIIQAILGPVLSSLRPTSRAISTILSWPNAWWIRTGHLHTIANRADKVVPASEAELGTTRVVNDSSCPVDLLFVRSCHGAVLSDASLNLWVACHWITNGSQCVAAPTPTVTPRPTLTPTPTTPATPSTMPTPPPLPSPTIVVTVPPPPSRSLPTPSSSGTPVAVLQ